ncbi:hypothetical protein SAMN05216246_1211, partial [Actinomyces denticolens]
MTTLYFEAEKEDSLRRVGYSKERRVDPQCQAPGFVEGVLSGADGCRLGLAGGLLADVQGL